jgi:hypothetical protein
MIEMILKAHEAGVDLDTLILPYFSDNLSLGIDAMLSSRTVKGLRGGVSFQMATLGGEYGSQKQQGVRVKIDRNFRSINSPDFERYQKMSVTELQSMAELVGKQLEELRLAEAPQTEEE